MNAKPTGKNKKTAPAKKKAGTKRSTTSKKTAAPITPTKRSEKEKPYISIIMATIRPKMVVDFLQNLQETAENPNNFEVRINVDDDDTETINALEKEKNNVDFDVYIYKMPRGKGYFTLHHGYQQMLEDTPNFIEFCWIMTDEIRMQTKGWDEKIKKFRNFFEDGIFRLRPTEFKLKNYYNFEECQNCPDNHPLVSKKWLQLTGGWGEFWAPDTWHQCLDYYFGMAIDHAYTLFRSLPIFEFEMEGLENSVSVDGKSEDFKVWMNIHGCHVMASRFGRENFRRMAARMAGHLKAIEAGHRQYILEEDYKEKTVELFSKNRKEKIYSTAYAAEWPAESQEIDAVEAKLDDWYWRAGNLRHQAKEMLEHKEKLVYHHDEDHWKMFPTGYEHIKFLMERLTPPDQEPQQHKAA